MRAEQAVELLHQMVAIPSPSGDEGELAVFLESAMRGLGMEASVDDAGNVIGETGTGDHPDVLLLGHLDTIDRPMPVRRCDGRLFGRGTVDAKSALAAMVCAAAQSAFPGRLRVAGVVEEETPASRGASHLASTMPAPDAVIVGEPSGWSGVILGYKGKLDLEYTVSRPATHPSNPAEKAGEAAIAFWNALLELLGPARSAAAFDLPAATLTDVAADMTEARMLVDCRLPPGFDAEALLAALRRQAGTAELRVLGCVPAVRAPRGNPAARSLSAAIRRRGGTPSPKVKTGTSDMNTVAVRWDVPMAAYGPGDSALDHSDREHVELEEYLRTVDVLTLAVAELTPERKAADA